ncbi:DUF4065 domain-containing protein [Tissierella sp. MSJ-40]|uniref:DUF4065 domain-containing protein n=1 Tax=Tissierella simiarum TaxID=2841534 RepID=A0ABS6E8R5_9FIRM|nr:type II toxin-antitoxin system antitoxin SocA domain-containing protein [Tissierella simiarum]MBU5439318.1 DUF4065 domain-containing protein [Tissierella simiarum]
MGNVVYLFKGGDKMHKEISVFDVASTLLTFEKMTNKKLQKLCYYAQAWHLAVFKEPLFGEKFEAWVHGPVCRELYGVYKVYGWNDITQSHMGSVICDEEKLEFLEMIHDTYEDFDGDELEALTHSELPWQEARKGLEEWEPSNELISEETMKTFYWNIYEQAQND